MGRGVSYRDQYLVCSFGGPMRRALSGLIITFSVTPVFAQTATVRVEVRFEEKVVEAADVLVNGTAFKTDGQGVVRATVPPGHVDVVVVKDGFMPTSASVDLQ